MIVAPLLHEGHVIGVLKSAAAEPDAFTIKDEQSTQLLASLIGSAIGHQQDYEEKQRLSGERALALVELNKAADELRISEQRTRVIVDSAHDAFIGMDRHGRINDWNQQAENIFGWTRGEALGQFAPDLIVSPAYRPLFAQHLASIFNPTHKPTGNARIELNVLRRTREEFVVEMTMSPIHVGDMVTLAVFMHDITERRQHQEKLIQLAQYDALTGLPNRALFMDQLNAAVLRIDRTRKAIGLLFLDLDGFKAINDGFGHQAGDKVLKDFAERLRQCVRRTDMVARLAGDEFTIILESLTDPTRDVQNIAAKILASMAQSFIVAGEQRVIGTSIGIAIGADHTQNIDILIQRADAQMYKAKHKGKNQFSLEDARA